MKKGERKVDEYKVRKAIVEENEWIKLVMLSYHAAVLVLWVKEKGSITSAELSEGQEISIQNASRQLCGLYNKGYLKRKEITSESGGIEYVYRTIFNN